MINLFKDGLRLCLCEPWTYYKAVRFDHGGVFRSIVKDGYCYAGEWFRHYEATTHDAVCGCPEEFVYRDYDSVMPGECWCKIGVGLIRRPDSEPYSIIKSYELVEAGKWTFEKLSDSSVRFKSVLDGFYEYEKTVEIVSGDEFEIRHSLRWLGSKVWDGWVYDHNFFTFDGDVSTDPDASGHGYSGTVVGPERRLEFPFKPEGDWRSTYNCVALTDNGIKFSAPVEPPSVFMGNLHAAGGEQTPMEICVSEGSRKVYINGFEDGEPAGAEKMVFWSNPDVACIEPYLPLMLTKGSEKRWSLRYKLV